MDTNKCTVVSRGCQYVEHLLIIELDAIVSHEDLDRGVSLFDKFRQVRFQSKLVWICQNHMEGIINHGAPIGEIVIVGDNAIECMPDVLRSERNNRRSAPKSC